METASYDDKQMTIRRQQQEKEEKEPSLFQLRCKEIRLMLRSTLNVYATDLNDKNYY